MRILQISCSYFPAKVGGTESYVHNLSKELAGRGHQSLVCFVTDFVSREDVSLRLKEYCFDTVPVLAIEKNTFKRLTEELYLGDNPELYRIFKEYLERIKPDVVHFHHFSPTDALVQMRVAKAMNLPVVLTYHTPMMTCGRGDMLYFGRRPCEGRIEYKKCLFCSQIKYGVPRPFAYLWLNLPRGVAEYLSRTTSKLNIKSRWCTWLQLPWLTRERLARWQEGFELVDQFVSVSQWVHDLLLKNNIPRGKVTLCRQGTTGAASLIKKEHKVGMRLGFIGRIHVFKGVDLLVKAFKMIPSRYQLALYVYGLPQENIAENRYYNRLRRESCPDKRIKWMGILEEKDKFQVLSELDALVIPSRWLETGPLVLLEAWAVKTPVIAASLGGITELLSEGIGGLLFKPEDAPDLARVIMRLYNDSGLQEGLKANIPQVRTMPDVAKDMEALYEKLIWQKRKTF